MLNKNEYTIPRDHIKDVLKNYMANGQRVQAIKFLRVCNPGLTLLEAKTYVEGDMADVYQINRYVNTSWEIWGKYKLLASYKVDDEYVYWVLSAENICMTLSSGEITGYAD